MDLNLNMVNHPHESNILYYLRLTQHLLAPFLWFMAFYFFIKLHKISLVHKNLRIILSITPTAVLSSTTSHLIFIHLIKLADGRQDSWIFEFLYFIVGLMHLSSSVFSGLIMFAIVLERLRASAKNQSYENSGTRFGIMLCVQEVVISILLAIFIISYDIWTLEATDPFYKYRYSFELHVLPAIVCYGCAGMGSVCSLSIMYKLYHRNQTMRFRTRGVVPLTARYQYNENVQSLRTLLPIMIMYCFCTIVGSVLAVYRQMRFSWAGPSDIVQMIYLQAGYMSMDIFILVGVPFMFLSYEPLKRLLFLDIRHLFGLEAQQSLRCENLEGFYSKHSPVAATTGDVYFKQLKELWM